MQLAQALAQQQPACRAGDDECLDDFDSQEDGDMGDDDAESYESVKGPVGAVIADDIWSEVGTHQLHTSHTQGTRT